MKKTILVAVDLEDEGLMRKMLQTAGEFARLYGAEISLVHVAADLPANVRSHLPDDYEHRMTGEVAGKLNTMIAALELPSGSVHVKVRVGTIYRAVLETAKELAADLIIVGSHKPDVTDFLLGSNAARIVRHSTCSVYVVR